MLRWFCCLIKKAGGSSPLLDPFRIFPLFYSCVIKIVGCVPTFGAQLDRVSFRNQFRDFNDFAATLTRNFGNFHAGPRC